MRWKELDGRERWQVLELMRKGEVPLKEICERFGVSRQTLYRAMDRADGAARQALQPRTAGRKAPSEEEMAQAQSKERIAGLNKELDRWKTKYEAAQAFLELERMYDRGQLPATAGTTTESTGGKKGVGGGKGRIAKRRRAGRR